MTMVPETPTTPESPVSSDTTAQAADSTTYSTLEVHHGKFVESDPNSAPIVRPDPDFLKIATYDPDNHKEIVVTETALLEGSEVSTSNTEQKILGLKRKTFFITLAVLIIVVLAAAIGGGIGGAAANRGKNEPAKASSPVNSTSSTSVTASATTTAETYANTGLAVMQWTDQSGILYKKLYYQDNANKIKESSWDNSTDFNTTWSINTISDSVMPETPIAAVAGYPHASYNYTLVSLQSLNSYYANKFRSRTCTTCHPTTNSSNDKPKPTTHNHGKTTTSPVYTAAANPPSSQRTGVKTSGTCPKS